MTQRLFVYGTLAPGRPHAHLLHGVKGSWERASVRGTLHQKGWGATLGFPAIVLDECGDEIDGYLFTSDELSEHWAMLDEFEGEGYERVLTVATLRDESTVDAYIYALQGA